MRMVRYGTALAPAFGPVLHFAMLLQYEGNAPVVAESHRRGVATYRSPRRLAHRPYRFPQSR